ncbi:MAG: hypothetical protein VB096_02405, partial [Pseudoflavonifractor sp.]|nr:hypothetical protein [Pseudoflavonifractor sp.]
AYYPPSADNLPYVLWLYTLGYPMTAEQRAMVTGNPSLMTIYNESLGAAKSVSVDFTVSDWTAGSGGSTLTLTRAQHGRQTNRFCYTLRHNVSGVLKGNTWGVRTAQVSYDNATGNITLWAEAAFAGEIVFTG